MGPGRTGRLPETRGCEARSGGPTHAARLSVAVPAFEWHNGRSNTTSKKLGTYFIWVCLILPAGCRPRDPQLREIALIDTAGWAHDIAFDGNDLFVADRQGGFLAIDRREFNRAPRVAAPVADVISLAPDGGRLLLACRFDGLVLASQSGQVLARWANGDIANAVEVQGDLAYIAYGLHGLVIARVAEKSIELVSQLPSPGWSHGLKLSDHRVFLADWNYGLRVVDVRDVRKPVEVGVLPTPATTIAISLHQAEGKLRAALAEGHAGIALADFDEAGRPSLLSRHSLGLNLTDKPHPETGGWVHGVAWSGRYLFAANWKRGLAVLDVHDVWHPFVVLERLTTGTALAVAAELQPDGSHLVFLADGEAGLRIFRFIP